MNSHVDQHQINGEKAIHVSSSVLNVWRLKKIKKKLSRQVFVSHLGTTTWLMIQFCFVSYFERAC